jgi:hypothetical protein
MSSEHYDLTVRVIGFDEGWDKGIRLVDDDNRPGVIRVRVARQNEPYDLRVKIDEGRLVNPLAVTVINPEDLPRRHSPFTRLYHHAGLSVRCIVEALGRYYLIPEDGTWDERVERTYIGDLELIPMPEDEGRFMRSRVGIPDRVPFE